MPVCFLESTTMAGTGTSTMFLSANTEEWAEFYMQQEPCGRLPPHQPDFQFACCTIDC